MPKLIMRSFFTGYVDGMGGIMSVAWAPLINESGRAAWEEYAWNNQQWLVESARLKKADAKHRDAGT